MKFEKNNSKILKWKTQLDMKFIWPLICFSRVGYYSYTSILVSVYQIFAIDVQSWREERDIREVDFYDPITNQNYFNLPAIFDFV